MSDEYPIIPIRSDEDPYGCCSVCRHQGDDRCDECIDADEFEPNEELLDELHLMQAA